MGVFCDRLKLGSKAALDCRTGQNKGRYSKNSSYLVSTPSSMVLTQLKVIKVYQVGDNYLGESDIILQAKMER